MGRLILKVVLFGFFAFILLTCGLLYVGLKTPYPLTFVKNLVNKSPTTKLDWSKAEGNLLSGFTVSDFSLLSLKAEIKFKKLSFTYGSNEGKSYFNSLTINELSAEGGSIIEIKNDIALPDAPIADGTQSPSTPQEGRRENHLGQQRERERRPVNLVIKAISFKDIKLGARKGDLESIFFDLEDFSVTDMVFSQPSEITNISVKSIVLKSNYANLKINNLEQTISPDGSFSINLGKGLSGMIKKELWAGLNEDLTFDITGTFEKDKAQFVTKIFDGNLSLDHASDKDAWHFKTDQLHISKYLKQSPVDVLSFEYEFLTAADMKQFFAMAPKNLKYELGNVKFEKSFENNLEVPASAPVTREIASVLPAKPSFAALSGAIIAMSAQTNEGTVRVETPGLPLMWLGAFVPGVKATPLITIIESPHVDEANTLSALFFGRKDSLLSPEEKQQASAWKNRIDFSRAKFAPPPVILKNTRGKSKAGLRRS